MQSIKVLHFYKTYYPETVGGIERSIFELATHLQTYGVDVDVLSLTSQKTHSEYQLTKHIAYKSRENFCIASTGFSFSVIFRFKELAKNADVINYHFPWPFMDLVHFICRINNNFIIISCMVYLKKDKKEKCP
jgi:rhamnosyl/mannosyltransferase